MTVLGIIFVGAYAISLMRGRAGVLVVVACSLAFNDSAAVVIGSAAVTPFYLGLLVYLPVAILSKSLRRPNAPRSPVWLLILFLAVTLVTAIVGPVLFGGVGVVAPGVGLDEQVGALTPLQFSLSSVAQIAYVTLNVAFVILNERDRLLREKHLALGLTLGVLVAMYGYISSQLGLPFPHELFDNSSRGFYATSQVRLRAQFAEPSHLGAFALTAAAFFTAYAFQAKRSRVIVWRTALALCSLLLLVSAASGTAVLGAFVAGFVFVVIGCKYVLTHGKEFRIAVPVGLVGVPVAIVLAPRAIQAGIDVLQGKVGGQSLNTRTFVNSHALQLFVDTWGFGVGLGNNRASSLILMLLSTIGVAAFLLFVAIVVRSITSGVAAYGKRPGAIALVAFISAAAVSLADFTAPVMWMSIALCFPSELPASFYRACQPTSRRQAGTVGSRPKRYAAVSSLRWGRGPNPRVATG